MGPYYNTAPTILGYPKRDPNFDSCWQPVQYEPSTLILLAAHRIPTALRAEQGFCFGPFRAPWGLRLGGFCFGFTIPGLGVWVLP